MTVGNTVTDSLSDSLNVVLAAARNVREYVGVMSQLADKETLQEGSGRSWREALLGALTAYSITESSVEDNPQQYSDSVITITPTMVSCHTLITDVVGRQIDKKALDKMGDASMVAIQRKSDQDGIAVFAGATTTLGITATTFSSAPIASAASRITSNATEPGPEPLYAVLHGYMSKDLWDEITAGVGTYVVPDGLTANIFTNKAIKMVSNVAIFEDGNITPDSTPDVRGGCFSSKAIVRVRENMPKSEVVREAKIGGGATSLFVRESYAYGERGAGQWLYGLIADGTVPA